VWTSSRINCEKRFRHNFQRASFLQAADIVTQIMNFGAPTPVEINVSGQTLARAGRSLKSSWRTRQVHALRTQYDEPLDYPSLDVSIDRSVPGKWELPRLA